MVKSRIIFVGFMTVDGFRADVQELDLESKESKGDVSFTLSPEQMDSLMGKWQEFRNGTNEKHLLLMRNYLDDVPAMNVSKYIQMDEEKSKQ